jgi:ATP diphosphatase
MSQFQVEDLLHLMSRLRDPSGGCPWDIKQTYDTIVPCTLEEAYEVADAIERKDFVHLQEELGDLLFQVIFYAQLGLEDGHFKFADVVDSLVKKLVRRHPHVFPSGDLHQTLSAQSLNAQSVSEEQIKGRWEAIKELERQAKGKAQAVISILDDVPRTLPAIQRAEKLQKRAALVGFDWPEASQVLDKIEEEIGELREAMLENDHAHIQDELGDVMFAMVNLARHVNVKPEMAIRSTNEKFERRFKYVESSLSAQGIALQEANLEQMELLWLAAKKLES